MRILSVKQLKTIQTPQSSCSFPLGSKTEIILDKKSPSDKKEHQLIYKQNHYFGTVGDHCTYLSNDELLELESKGMIEIRKAKSN